MSKKRRFLPTIVPNVMLKFNALVCVTKNKAPFDDFWYEEVAAVSEWEARLWVIKQTYATLKSAGNPVAALEVFVAEIEEILPDGSTRPIFVQQNHTPYVHTPFRCPIVKLCAVSAALPPAASAVKLF